MVWVKSPTCVLYLPDIITIQYDIIHDNNNSNDDDQAKNKNKTPLMEKYYENLKDYDPESDFCTSFSKPTGNHLLP